MSDRRPRARNHAREARLPDRRVPLQDDARAAHAAEFQRAEQLFAAVVIPGVDAFRAFMETQHRKVRATAFPDHVEGPQIMVQIPRADGRVTATLAIAVTAEGLRPYWDVQRTGRVTAHRVDKVRGGAAALTQERILETLQELASPDD